MPDEYISREAALKYIKSEQCRTCSDIGLCGNCAVLVAVKLLEKVPAADVAEVVRCKDCAKHYIVLGRDMCARNAQGSEGHWIGLSATVPDGFCHRGVHK